MAHPKSKISKQRKRKRRTHYKIEAPNVNHCNNCGAPKLMHHVCGECGHYRGRLMVAPKVEEVIVEDAGENDVTIEE